MMKYARFFALTVLIAALNNGCTLWRQADIEPDAIVEQLRVTHHAGGTHYKTIVADDVWYQTFGSSLLTIDANSGELISEIELGQVGKSGPAIDMVLDGSALYIVLEDDALVELDCTSTRTPKIVRSISAAQLGIQPQRLSVAGGELYISGPEGVMRDSDGAVMLRDIGNEGDVKAVSHVVVGADGPIACIGRRAYRLSDGKYVGSASDMFVLPDEFGLQGGFVFSRKTTNGQLIGLMTPQVREVDTQTATIIVEGTVRNIRVFSGRLWVVGDFRISSYAIRDGALVDPLHIDVIGARDVDRIDDNYIAIAGSFGRSVYRIDDSSDGAGDEFLSSHREPGNLLYAQSDGRHTVALGLSGAWIYDQDCNIEFIDIAQENFPEAITKINTTLVSAAIADDGKSIVIVNGAKEQTYHDKNNAMFYCLAAINGEIWIGHERGITVLGIDSANKIFNKSQLRLVGPIRYIFPKLNGGEVIYVSEFGGFGTVKFQSQAIVLGN